MEDRALTDLLERLLLRLDVDGEVVVGTHEIAEWPEGTLDHLVRLGVLVRGTNATGLVCDECEEACWVTPERFTRPSGEQILVSPCRMGHEDAGLLIFPLDRLLTWRVDVDGLAKALSKAGDLRGRPAELVPQRLWRIGSLGTGRSRRVVLLAPRLARLPAPERSDLLDRAGPTSCVILVPYELPADVAAHRAVVVPLSEVLELDDGGLLLDLEAVAAPATVAKSPVKVVPLPRGAGWESLVVRVMDDENVQVIAGNRIEVRSYQDLGMIDRRRREPTPNETWAFLLALAEAGGSMTWRDDAAEDANRKRVSGLRKALRTMTGLSRDPFHPYAPGRGWVPRFHLVDARGAS